MKITMTLNNTEEMEVRRVANELHIEPKVILTKLRNIYQSNLPDDLIWIAEIIEEDKQNASL